MPLQPKPQNKETRANKSATVSKKESSAKKVRIQHIEKIVCCIQTNYFVSEIYMYVNKWEL